MDELRFIHKYVEPVLLGIIFLIASVGNILLVFVFTWNSQMRKGPNLFIINLIFADMLVVLISLPSQYLQSLEYWILSTEMCRIFIFIEGLIIGSSAYSIVALSLTNDARVMHILLGNTGSRSICFICIIWAAATIFSVPSLIFSSDMCHTNGSHNLSFVQYIFIFELLAFLIFPVCIILYVHMRTSMFMSSNAEGIRGEDLKQRRIDIALTVGFCISYGPMFLTNILLSWSVLGHGKNMLYFHYATLFLHYFSICFNPIILYIMSNNYRKEINMYVFFWYSVNSVQNSKIKSAKINIQSDNEQTTL